MQHTDQVYTSSHAWTCPMLQAAEGGHLGTMLELRKHTPAAHRDKVIVALERLGLGRACRQLLQEEGWVCVGVLNSARHAAVASNHLGIVRMLDVCIARRVSGLQCV